MKIEKYIKQLQKLAEQEPGATVVYSIDDEGNAYHPVSQRPCPGYYVDGEFITDEMILDAKEIGERFDGIKKSNRVICIN